jgi:nucleoside 2-deoxyribosyltransferase
MKFFIAMRVPRDDPSAELLASAVAGVLNSTGNTPFIAYQEIARRGLSPEQFMPYVRGEISTSNIVLVVYSPDLRGGLIELGIAYALGVPVWMAVHNGERVSRSARACASKIIEYTTLQELETDLRVAIIGGNSL